MHYGDKPQAEENKIVVVVYLHGPDKCLMQLSSIQSCQYVQPQLVNKLLTVPEFYIDKNKLDEEEYYEVELKEGEWDLEVISIKNVSNDPDEFIWTNEEEQEGYSTSFKKLH